MKRCILFFLFALCLGCEQEWHIAVLGDSCVGRPERSVPQEFPRILETINQQEPELVFHTGDLVFGRTLYKADTQKQYRAAEEILKQLRMPLYPVPGNHDAEGAKGMAEYTSRFGDVPWEIRHRGWVFIGLNTEVPGSRGFITGEQLHWLRSRLSERKDNHGTVVLMHRPVWPTKTREHGYHSLPQPELHRLFTEQGVTAVFAGHEHHFHEEVRDGIIYITTGGAGDYLLKGGYYHFVLVKIRNDQLSSRVIRLDTKSDVSTF